MVKNMWLIHEKWILQHLSALELQKKNLDVQKYQKLTKYFYLSTSNYFLYVK